MFFDFHHHRPNYNNGIFNLPMFETAPKEWFSAGIHPWDISKFNEDEMWNWLEVNVKLPNCFAIGECGLDGLIEADFKTQSRIFENQILLANDLKKPVIVHCVKRFSELISFQKIAKTKMIVHGFNKKESVADELLNHNFYLSFGKPLLYNLSLQKTFEKVPLNRFFLETDNDDFEIGDLYKKAAELKKMSVEELQKLIAENLDTIKNG